MSILEPLIPLVSTIASHIDSRQLSLVFLSIIMISPFRCRAVASSLYEYQVCEVHQSLTPGNDDDSSTTEPYADDFLCPRPLLPPCQFRDPNKSNRISSSRSEHTGNRKFRSLSAIVCSSSPHQGLESRYRTV